MSLQQLVDEVRASLPEIQDQPGQPPYYAFLFKLVIRLQPKSVLVLGADTERAAAIILDALPQRSLLHVIGNDPVAELVGRHKDWRLKLLSDGATFAGGVDLMFQGAQDAWWHEHIRSLADGCLICCDGISSGFRKDFWNALPGEKVATDLSSTSFGIFRHKR